MSPHSTPAKPRSGSRQEDVTSEAPPELDPTGAERGYLITYAQNREDLIIDAFFPDVEKGFYVDVGANHPSLDSVTKFFYLRGWRGVNIEPSRRCYELLLAERPEDRTFNVGVSDRDGRLAYREYENTALSTFSETLKEAHREVGRQEPYVELEVEVTTLASLLEEAGVGHVHFLKVDAEGHEYEVLAGNDWSRFRPELVCVEAGMVLRDWRPLLAEADYHLAFFDGLNEYYLAVEAMSRKETFAYVDRVLLGGPVVPYWLHLELEAARGRIDQVESVLSGRGSVRAASAVLARAVAARLPSRAKKLARRVLHPRA